MDRRCNSTHSCRIDQVKKFAFLDLPVANHLVKPVKEWSLLVKDINKQVRVAKHVIDVDWKKYSPENYVFSHCSIVASVATDETGYRVVKPCDELVNSNGNAWTNLVLPSCFRSFVGAENYYEHIQIPELSKGKIIDAALRPVKYIGSDGKSSADVFYVDILVATNKKHVELVRRILSGELSTLSMGALANKCQCSFCGLITDDYHPNCEHLDRNMREYITDDKGNKYIVSELCGVVDNSGNYVPNSCYFIEASWVENPAFPGAVINYLIGNPKIDNKIDEITASREISSLFDLDESILSQLKVADIRHMIAIRLALQEVRRMKYSNIVDNIVSEIIS